MMDRNILVVNILEEGRFGGPQRRVLEVAHELKKYHVETIVVSPKKNSLSFQTKLDKLNISFLSVDINRLTNNPIGLIKYAISFIPEVLKLKAIIREYKPCIVHVNGSYQIKGVIAANLANVPSVWHLNDTYAPAPVRCLFFLTKSIVKTNFISAAHRTKDYYLGGDKKHSLSPVVNEPVDCAYFDPTERQYFDKKDVIRIVLVGNLSPVKAIEVFLDMAACVNRTSNRTLEFIVVGKKLESQSLYYDTLIEKKDKLELTNLTFLGGVDDVKPELQKADIYVCSSNFESSPMSIWEAMSMALPIVSTDVGDVKLILEEGECGLIAQPGDFEKLAQLVLRYIEHADLAKAHGSNARSKALSAFDIDICTKAHHGLYKKIWNK